jgi:hypothetical protein
MVVLLQPALPRERHSSRRTTESREVVQEKAILASIIIDR